MPDFNKRSNEIEIMDDLTSSGHVIDQTLKELETINKWLGGNYVTINGIEKLITTSTKELTIADLGCGGGDMLKLIANWSRKNNIKLKLIGIDANPNIIEFAKRNCIDFPEISFLSINIFDDAFKEMKFDIITATLFTHHFTDEELIILLNQFKSQCHLGLVINDLHRHWFAYYSIKCLTSLFSKSEMVKNDAAVSVMRSFRKTEITEILKSGRLKNFTIQWMWAFRWQIIIMT
jgi:2-polyprenyl-3-methyl-5-hydroxy-6-metoxy-1,4-benzoquinol methylase